MTISGKAMEGIMDSIFGFHGGKNAFVIENGKYVLDKNGDMIDQIEYSNGYFQSHLDFIDNYHDILEEVKSINNEHLFKLLELEIGWWWTREGEKSKYMLNMNDVFGWGCADGEDVEENEYAEVIRLYELYGYDGLNYWVANKRGYLEDPGFIELIDISKGHADIYNGIESVRRKEALETAIPYKMGEFVSIRLDSEMQEQIKKSKEGNFISSDELLESLRKEV